MDKAMVNREVNSIVVRAIATMAIRLRVRLASRLFHAKWRTHFRFETFMALPPYCVTIRPSSMRTIRSESWAISSLCVIMTIVWENFRPVTFIRLSTSWLVRLSRFPVGSSARRMAGLVAKARAIATRCCWPPESCPGRLFNFFSSPRAVTTSPTQRSSTLPPSNWMGKTMFSRTVSTGTRLKL